MHSLSLHWFNPRLNVAKPFIEATLKRAAQRDVSESPDEVTTKLRLSVYWNSWFDCMQVIVVQKCLETNMCHVCDRFQCRVARNFKYSETKVKIQLPRESRLTMRVRKSTFYLHGCTCVCVCTYLKQGSDLIFLQIWLNSWLLWRRHEETGMSWIGEPLDGGIKQVGITVSFAQVDDSHRSRRIKKTATSAV